MNEDFTMKSGDTAPAIQDSLTVGGKALPAGTLTGAVIRFQSKNVINGAIIINNSSRVTVIQDDGVATIVQYQWAVGDTATVGIFLKEWEVTYVSGLVETFPNSRYSYFAVLADATDILAPAGPVPVNGHLTTLLVDAGATFTAGPVIISGGGLDVNGLVSVHNGLTVTAGLLTAMAGVTVSAGGVTVTAGGLTLNDASLVRITASSSDLRLNALGSLIFEVAGTERGRFDKTTGNLMVGLSVNVGGVVQLANGGNGYFDAMGGTGTINLRSNAGSTTLATFSSAGSTVYSDLSTTGSVYVKGGNPSFDVKAWGAKVDGQELKDGVTTAASGVLTSASGKFVPGDVGKACVVLNAGTLLIANPTVALTAVDGGTGATNLPTGNYTFVYTWITRYGGETTGGTSALVYNQTVANHKINFTLPSLPANAVVAQLWCTVAPAGAFTGRPAVYTIGTTCSYVTGLTANNQTVPAVSTAGEALVTTIASYQSATQVTLTAAATLALTAASFLWGTDDTTAIQATFNAAKLTGGRMNVSLGIALVSVMLAFMLNGTTDRAVIIQGAGTSYSPDQVTGIRPASTIKWIGAIGGTVINPGFGSVALRDIQIDCNSGLADIGVLATDVQSSGWSNVHVVDDNAWAYKFLASTAGVYDNQFNHLTSQCQNAMGGGCLLDSNLITVDVAGNDWTACFFFTNGTNAGLDISAGDNNSFLHVTTRRGAVAQSQGVNANGIIFRAAAGQKLGALTNYMFHVDGSGPIVHNVNSTNFIFGLDYTNGFAAPSGTNMNQLVVLGASDGSNLFGAQRPNNGAVVSIGETNSGFTSASLGIILKDTTSPGIRLERTGQVAYEIYIPSDNTLHVGPLVVSAAGNVTIQSGVINFNTTSPGGLAYNGAARVGVDATGIGFYGHATVAQPAAPVTLADVIAVIRGCGLSA